ncbi:hypothetical protein ACIQMY_05300 [Streptomyces sp. NPDC091368]|uniref:hypothetical protein n=1 Tax=Streptomyces sp. NPDC091368 TaxID=3365993 RepID=UPI003812446E
MRERRQFRHGAHGTDTTLEHLARAAALTRLTAASARCRQAGHPQAADVLDALRQELRSR